MQVQAHPGHRQNRPTPRPILDPSRRLVLGHLPNPSRLQIALVSGLPPQVTVAAAAVVVVVVVAAFVAAVAAAVLLVLRLRLLLLRRVDAMYSSSAFDSYSSSDPSGLTPASINRWFSISPDSPSHNRW